jgi:glycogen debranching enzyme
MPLVQHITCRELDLRDRSKLLTSEWLVTNGLGGYSSGTAAGVATRRYHGLLVAALPAPLGRRMVASNLAEYLQLPDGKQVQLSGERYPSGEMQLEAVNYLSRFRLEMGLPVWQWEVDGITFEKQIALAHKNQPLADWHLQFHSSVAPDGRRALSGATILDQPLKREAAVLYLRSC